ncbi:hypothetical protein ONZ43_g1584 [Nemania bipapillata]|uniref:Uncharacterized protein n=1 Tax=Nemania bipapillata TaxID=110536 RepID=A0ACC2J3Y8_9PEZI|nr:hypothetical protein ONZ43_g1584 [Nemania bipapillata]
MQDAEHQNRNGDGCGHSLPQRRRWYLSPYHDSPVDLDKYEAEMSATNKSSANDACWADKPEKDEKAKAPKQKKKKNGKHASQAPSTGSAANFKPFGKNSSAKGARLD